MNSTRKGPRHASRVILLLCFVVTTCRHNHKWHPTIFQLFLYARQTSFNLQGYKQCWHLNKDSYVPIRIIYLILLWGIGAGHLYTISIPVQETRGCFSIWSNACKEYALRAWVNACGKVAHKGYSCKLSLLAQQHFEIPYISCTVGTTPGLANLYHFCSQSEEVTDFFLLLGSVDGKVGTAIFSPNLEMSDSTNKLVSC